MDKRLKIFQIVMAILFILLIFTAGYLQLISGEYFHNLSDGNRISIRPINAPRGKIYVNSREKESEYKTLVSNKLSYNLYILPNEIPSDLSVNDLLKRITELVDFETIHLDENNLDDINFEESDIDEEQSQQLDTEEKEFELLKNNYKQNQESNQITSLPILLKRNLSSENMLVIEENKEDLPGILVKESTTREYIYEDMASHVLEGIERKYTSGEEDYLEGTDG
ncbi:MAG: hypothetical protein ACOCQ5_05125, partial [Halanaerobiales bacterium]